MKTIKLYIIDEPFPYASMEVLGHTLREYPYISLAAYEPETIPCIGSVDYDKTETVAVIYSDMPLITPRAIEEAARISKEKGAASLGRGFVVSGKKECTPAETSLESECISVRCPDSLSDVYRALCQRNIRKAIDGGAIILDRTAIYIDETVKVEAGAIIHPMVTLKGSSIIKSGAVIRSGSVIENSIIGREANVLASFVYDSEIGEKTTIGPCSLIRAGSVVGSDVRIGDFVEIKASRLGDGCKAAHLTYIGDAELGVEVNVGCGTVFANYNGKIKQKTYVGDYAFIGSNTNLVAPVKVGNRAFTAAGSTVTEDVPDNTLCIARARQVHKERKS